MAEFWMIEPEMVFVDLDDNMCSGRGVVKVRDSLRALENASAETNFSNPEVRGQGSLDRLKMCWNWKLATLPTPTP